VLMRQPLPVRSRLGRWSLHLLHSAHLPAVVRRGASAVAVLLLAGCRSGAPLGDPGDPVALGGTAIHSLSAVQLLACPGERVREISVATDVSTDGPPKVGVVVWRLEATGVSSASTFEPGVPVAGFQTLVTPTLPITGRIVVLMQTTLTSTESGTVTATLPVGSMSISGELLTPSTQKAFLRNRCH
jgi:hypothetical protein